MQMHHPLTRHGNLPTIARGRHQLTRIDYGAKHNRYPKTEYDFAKHGTEAGARAHWRRGEKPCEPCRLAANRAHRDRQRARR